MKVIFSLLSLSTFFVTVFAHSSSPDEPLSRQSWSHFGPLSQYYVAGRKEKPPEAFNLLKAYVPCHAKILDLGCGTGISSRQLIKSGFKQVIGVDRDPLMLEKAEAANDHICSIKYLLGNVADELPFPDEEFDVVTAVSAFHWFANSSSVREVARLLKPRGYYFIVGGMSNKNKKVINPIKQQIKLIIQEVLGQPIPKKEIGSVVERLESEGYFKVLMNTSVSYQHEYTKEEYLNAIKSRSLWHFVKDSPQREVVLKRIDQYLDSLIDREGKIKEEGAVEVTLAQKVDILLPVSAGR